MAIREFRLPGIGNGLDVLQSAYPLNDVCLCGFNASIEYSVRIRKEEAFLYRRRCGSCAFVDDHVDLAFDVSHLEGIQALL